MEAVPRMPMIPVEMKLSPVSVEFGNKLRSYISSFYHENSDAYDSEISELEKLRDSVIHIASPDLNGCLLLKKYYAQLYMLKSRFPMGANDHCAVQFVWHDKYGDLLSPTAFSDIGYEMACIMHNIGAVHSVLAALDTRSNSEGLKVACTHFQCAAWAFQQIRDNQNCTQCSIDFDKGILSWYANLMLAQAQECILEKSLLDNRKNNIVAKVSMQVVEFYKICVKSLDNSSVLDIVGSSKVKSWTRFVEMKVKYYLAIAYLYLGNQAEELNQMGERLAYHQAANNALQEARKLCAKQDFDTAEQSLTFANDVIAGRFNNSKKENDIIYHDRVPALDSLPELRGVCLVKGIGFDPLDPEVSGPDIFGRLVPLPIHEASSLYSEEKAKLLREVTATVETKDQELGRYLSALQVDQLCLDPVSTNAPLLPHALVERCAFLNSNANEISDVERAAVERLPDVCYEVRSKLEDLVESVEHEIKELQDIESSFEKQNGMSSAISEATELRTELGYYTEALAIAHEANKDLNSLFAAQLPSLRELQQPLLELQKNLPPVAPDGLSSPEGAEVKRLLSKVEEMRLQRDELLVQLRTDMLNDDITKRLISSQTEDHSELFSQELRKHEKQIKIIEQNLAAQQNILDALTEANAKYADVRKALLEAKQTRETKIAALIESYDTMRSVAEKAERGVQFFEKVSKAVSGLKERFVEVQRMKNEVLQKLKIDAERKAKEIALARDAAAASTAAAQFRKPENMPANTADDPASEGPKLKDYLAYYRAKKVGQNVPFPGSGSFAVEQQPSAATLTTIANGHNNFGANSAVNNGPVRYQTPAVPSIDTPSLQQHQEFAAATVRMQQYLDAYNRGMPIPAQTLVGGTRPSDAARESANALSVSSQNYPAVPNVQVVSDNSSMEKSMSPLPVSSTNAVVENTRIQLPVQPQPAATPQSYYAAQFHAPCQPQPAMVIQQPLPPVAQNANAFPPQNASLASSVLSQSPATSYCTAPAASSYPSSSVGVYGNLQQLPMSGSQQQQSPSVSQFNNNAMGQYQAPVGTVGSMPMPVMGGGTAMPLHQHQNANLRQPIVNTSVAPFPANVYATGSAVGSASGPAVGSMPLPVNIGINTVPPQMAPSTENHNNQPGAAPPQRSQTPFYTQQSLQAIVSQSQNFVVTSAPQQTGPFPVHNNVSVANQIGGINFQSQHQPVSFVTSQNIATPTGSGPYNVHSSAYLNNHSHNGAMYQQPNVHFQAGVLPVNRQPQMGGVPALNQNVLPSHPSATYQTASRPQAAIAPQSQVSVTSTGYSSTIGHAYQAPVAGNPATFSTGGAAGNVNVLGNQTVFQLGQSSLPMVNCSVGATLPPQQTFYASSMPPAGAVTSNPQLPQQRFPVPCQTSMTANANNVPPTSVIYSTMSVSVASSSQATRVLYSTSISHQPQPTAQTSIISQPSPYQSSAHVQQPAAVSYGGPGSTFPNPPPQQVRPEGSYTVLYQQPSQFSLSNSAMGTVQNVGQQQPCASLNAGIPETNLPAPLTPVNPNTVREATAAKVVQSKALQDDLAGLTITAPKPIEPTPVSSQSSSDIQQQTVTVKRSSEENVVPQHRSDTIMVENTRFNNAPSFVANNLPIVSNASEVNKENFSAQSTVVHESAPPPASDVTLSNATNVLTETKAADLTQSVNVTDITDPTKFSLDGIPKRKKTTKQDFLNGGSHIIDCCTGDPEDPFSAIDPFWTMKK